MKGLTPAHLEILYERLEGLRGARLQKIESSERDLVLGLWTSRGMTWLWVDLETSMPFLSVMQTLPGSIPKRRPPVVNFLNAHGVGLDLQSVELQRDYGRVLLLIFGEEDKMLRMQIRLINRAPNIILQTQNKQISWNKVRELVDYEWRVEAGPSLELVTEEWVKHRFKQHHTPHSVDKIESLYKKEKLRLQKSLEKSREDVERKKDPLWRQAGEWLKENQNLDAPEILLKAIDKDLSLSANIENCFKKAKDNETKVEGAQARLTLMQEQLRDLEKQSVEQWYARANNGTKTKSLKKEDKIKARSLQLDDHTKAFFGKSGADNLKLLRQARSWDYWVHLKDEPGSHGLVLRPKEYELKQEQWLRVLSKLVEATLGEKAKERRGSKFSMLICETRFVKPIKGDRLGRVTYQNERLMTLVYEIF